MSYCAGRAPKPLAGATRAIDRSILGEWLGGDDAAINALLLVFRDSLCAEHARMQDALARDDLVNFAKTAHRLRGAALSMGAHPLAEAAAALDAAARVKDAASCVAGMGGLTTLIQLTVAEIPPAPGQSCSGQ